MDIALAIMTVLFAVVSSWLFTMAYFKNKYDDKNEAVGAIMVGVITTLCAIGFAIVGIACQNDKVVETKTLPQIDTVITIKDGTADSTYYYKFEDGKMVLEP